MSDQHPPSRETVFGRLPLPERQWVLEQLKDETVGGALLIAAAAIALVWANSPWSAAYFTLGDITVGPAVLHLDLSLATWAADGLLAVFFFVAGLELKHELVNGSLSSPAQAAVPVAAAIGGMMVPAALYAAVNLVQDGGDPTGWGIPMATDIAFALAVLAVAGSKLPVALRAFLLTLAVVDDLGAILVIALFYSDAFQPVPFVLAILGLVLYWYLQHQRVTSALVYVPLAFAIWTLMHASGIHATVAGVALAMLTRIKQDSGEAHSPAERLQHRIHPVSAGFCVPVFAFFAAGVSIQGLGLDTALTTPVAIGIMLGLVVGKPVGVLVGAWLTATFTRASLAAGLSWLDLAAVGVLAGIGFTVSLLISDLAFVPGSEYADSAKIAILAASLLSALIAVIALQLRARQYLRLAETEERDLDGDGIPDVYGDPPGAPLP